MSRDKRTTGWAIMERRRSYDDCWQVKEHWIVSLFVPCETHILYIDGELEEVKKKARTRAAELRWDIMNWEIHPPA